MTSKLLVINGCSAVGHGDSFVAFFPMFSVALHAEL